MAETLSDGSYTIDVSLNGGSGRASVQSPAKLTVEDGQMQAEIEWSSSHYDYMEVDGKAYYPVNDSGHSRFIIEVSELDTDIPVQAETVAMSSPHMIDYTLCFDSSTVKSDSGSNVGGMNGIVTLSAAGLGILLAAAAGIVILKRKLKR